MSSMELFFGNQIFAAIICLNIFFAEKTGNAYEPAQLPKGNGFNFFRRQNFFSPLFSNPLC
jgi:hypothetical protein